jgi:ribosome-associated toxin RatA of RatAB toxin-antitoxin module
MTAPPAGPPPPAPRRRRRLVIPLLLLVVLLGLIGYLAVRGTRADATPHDPSRPEDGPVSEVYQPPGDTKRVRAAVVLNQPPRRVQDLVTDYKHYSDFLPYLADVHAEHSKDGYHLTGQAKSIFPGYWPFAIDVREERSGDFLAVRWNERGAGKVRVNNGSWEVIPHGKDQTLLVLSLETEVEGIPTFLMRNVFLYRLKRVLRAVDRHLKESAG